MRKIDELKSYDKNPRKISQEDFDLLKSSLEEFGDLSGVIFNRETGNLVGGHQRTHAFKSKETEIVCEEFTVPSKTGTVAQGFVEVDGEKFAYREVEWNEDKEARANILANKVSGQWDYDILANAFDEELLLESGWKASEIGFDTEPEKEETEGKTEKTKRSGNVHEMILRFTSEEFDYVVERLDEIMDREGAESHTETVIKMCEKYGTKE